MIFEFDFIAGFMVGLEFYQDELFGSGMILDLGIVRILIGKVPE